MESHWDDGGDWSGPDFQIKSFFLPQFFFATMNNKYFCVVNKKSHTKYTKHTIFSPKNEPSVCINEPSKWINKPSKWII